MFVGALLCCRKSHTANAGRLQPRHSADLGGLLLRLPRPDEKQRKAKLRLDVRDEAIKKAIVPGKSPHKRIAGAIASNDPDEVMPPPTSKKPAVTPAQAKLLQPLDRRRGQVRSRIGHM